MIKVGDLVNIWDHQLDGSGPIKGEVTSSAGEGYRLQVRFEINPKHFGMCWFFEKQLEVTTPKEFYDNYRSHGNGD